MLLESIMFSLSFKPFLVTWQLWALKGLNNPGERASTLKYADTQFSCSYQGFCHFGSWEGWILSRSVWIHFHDKMFNFIRAGIRNNVICITLNLFVIINLKFGAHSSQLLQHRID